MEVELKGNDHFLSLFSGYQEFPVEKQTPIAISKSKRKAATSENYCEEEEEQAEGTSTSIKQLDARQFFVKSSQETKTIGRGTNNPRLSRDARNEFLVQVCGPDPIPAIHRVNDRYHKRFSEFNDSSDGKVRASPSIAHLYRTRHQIPLATKAQIDEFVSNAKRLTIGTDGVSFGKCPITALRWAVLRIA